MVRIIVLFLICTSLLLAEYVPGKIIVKFKKSPTIMSFDNNLTTNILPDSVQKLNKFHKIKQMKWLGTKKKGFDKASAERIRKADERYGIDQVYELEIDVSANIPLIVEQYKNDSNVDYAQPVYLYQLMAGPNDPLTPNQTYYSQIFPEKGWDICTGSSSVIIAIIDTGVSLSHEDLVDKIVPGKDFYYSGTPYDGYGHGTRVAGIAAASGNNGKGICGVDWNAKIMPLKVFNSSGIGATTTMIYNAINYAKNNGADVINMSFGGEYNDPAVESACNSAYSSNLLLVAAMGNTDITNNITQQTILYPAAYSSVIGVGSIDPDNSLSYFSVYGSGTKTTELVAPGRNIFSTTLTGYDADIQHSSGTSFASPQVAGICALMKAAHPSMSNEQIRLALHNSADDLGGVGYDEKYGYGRINVYQALSLQSTYASKSSATLTDVYNFPNPVTGEQTRFSFKSDKSVKSALFVIYDLMGRELNRLEAGTGMAGSYATPAWDCTDSHGNKLSNGTYIYVLEVTDGNDLISYAKGKMSIVN